MGGSQSTWAGSFKSKNKQSDEHLIPALRGSKGSSNHSYSWCKWTAGCPVPQVDFSVNDTFHAYKRLHQNGLSALLLPSDSHGPSIYLIRLPWYDLWDLDHSLSGASLQHLQPALSFSGCGSSYSHQGMHFSFRVSTPTASLTACVITS